MSDSEVVYTSEMRVKIEQHSDGGVRWFVLPEDEVAGTLDRSNEELAAANVPLSILSIRLLCDFIDKHVMNLVIGRASGYLWRAHAKKLEQAAEFASEEFEGSVVTESGEEVAVH